MRRSNRIGFDRGEEKRRDENAPGSIRLAHVKKVAFVTQVLWRVGGTNSPVGDGRGVGADAPVCRLGSATGVPLATRAETLGLASACACLPPRSATNARLDAALHASRPLFCRDGALASSPSRVRRPARSRRTALVAVTGIHRGRRLRRDAPGVRSRVTLRPNLSAARPAVPPGRLLVTWTREELPQWRKRREGRRF